MAYDAGYPLSYDNRVQTFTAANSTQAKILVDVTSASGNYLGGCRVLEVTATSTDSSNKDMMQYIGIQTTLYASMGTASITATTNSTITRSSGSFITDGYQVGDLIMCFGTTNSANSGLVATVTGVAALTLTLNGTTGLPNAETPGAGFRIFRISTRPRITVAANSGTSGSSADVNLIASSNDSSIDRTGFWLGSSNALIFAAQAAVSALPAYISLDARIALY